MNEQILQELLLQREDARLEFKRELHRIYDSDSNVKKKHRDELIRDILSLANGSPNVAGETSYLIIGVGDILDAGDREIFGVSGKIPNGRDILSMVKDASEPPLGDLVCEEINLRGKNVLVITIPPSPHLHETTRKIEATSGTFTEHTAFIRRDDSIRIASAKDRAAIQDLKTIRITEKRNAPPVIFGAANGALVGRVIATSLVEKWSTDNQEKTTWVTFMTIVGGILGAMIGNSYSGLLRIYRELQSIPTRWRPAALAAVLGSGLGVSAIINKLLGKLLEKLTSKTPNQH